MCLPAAPLMLISAAMSAAGSVAGGMSASGQAKYESQIAQQNARLATQSARESIEAGKDEARDYYREVAQTKGNQVAAMAANGIDVGFGTADRVQSDTRMIANEDAATLYKNINNRTKGFVIDAYNYKSEAKAAKAKGKAALIGGIIGAAGTLAGGAAQYKKQTFGGGV